MTEILKYEDVTKHLSKNKRTASLLMGNGFSVAFNKDIFTYNALANFLKSSSDNLINTLFNTIKTNNFELIMRQLETTIALLEAFHAEKETIENIRSSSETLKNGLIKSIQEMHPEHVFKVETEKSVACSNFLEFYINSGGHLFTTNYDLLLYWVLMRNGIEKNCDGFGKELTNPNYKNEGEVAQYSELVWGPNKEQQNVHYLHVALHIFDGKIDIIKEQYNIENFLLDNVRQRINSGNYPIFVTAGNGEQKLAHIRSNRYLSYCYEKLSKIEGSLVSFGFAFGEYDEHIIDALNRASYQHPPSKLFSIYIGTYSQDDIDYIDSIKHKFLAKVKIFDAKTAPVWGVA